MNTRRRHLRYGGPWFVAASALPVGGDLNRLRGLAQLICAAVGRPWRLIALVGLLLRTPKLDVELSDSAAGRMLREHFDQRFPGGFPLTRLCQGVLVLPERHCDYLRGRGRRALRNNLRRASAAGLRCEDVGSPASALRAMQDVVERRHAPVTSADRAALEEVWPAVFTHPQTTVLVARDPAGSALAVAGVVIDTRICVMVLAVARSHAARWALHDSLVRTLIARRVKYLLAADGGPFGALGLAPDVQYFQRLLGYELCHVSACRADEPRRARGRRRARSLYEQLATWRAVRPVEAAGPDREERLSATEFVA